EVAVADARLRRQAVLQGDRGHALLEAPGRDPGRLAAERARSRLRKAPCERGLPDHAFGLARLRLRLGGGQRQLFVDLVGCLVDERAGAEHHLDRVRPRQLAAWPVSPALTSQRACGYIA